MRINIASRAARKNQPCASTGSKSLFKATASTKTGHRMSTKCAQMPIVRWFWVQVLSANRFLSRGSHSTINCLQQGRLYDHRWVIVGRSSRLIALLFLVTKGMVRSSAMLSHRKASILCLWVVSCLLADTDVVQGQTIDPQSEVILENDILIRRELDRIDAVLPKLQAERDDWDVLRGALDQTENKFKSAQLNIAPDLANKVQAKLTELQTLESPSLTPELSPVPDWFSDLPEIQWRSVDEMRSAMRSVRNIQPGRGQTGLIIRTAKVLLELTNLVTSLDNLFDRFSNRVSIRCGYDNAIFEQNNDRLKQVILVSDAVRFLSDCNNALQTELFKESFESFRSDLISLVSEAKGRADSRINELDSRITNLQDRQITLQQKLSRRTEISDTLIRYALPAFGALILFLLLVPRVYSQTVQAAIFGQGLLLEVLTVFLLTASILILGLADKIPKDALGTLLGGISGYVLGRTLGARRGQRVDQPESLPPAPPAAAPPAPPPAPPPP